MKIIILILSLFIILGCASKPEVVVIGQNTYYFEEGVENFYVVDIETGEKVKIK